MDFTVNLAPCMAISVLTKRTCGSNGHRHAARDETEAEEVSNMLQRVGVTIRTKDAVYLKPEEIYATYAPVRRRGRWVYLAEPCANFQICMGCGRG